MPAVLRATHPASGLTKSQGGAVLREIKRESGATVNVLPRDAVGTTPNERVVVIDGTIEERTAAFQAVHLRAEEEAKKLGGSPDAAEASADAAAAEANVVPLKVLLRNELVGVIIGKGGATIKKLSADLKVKIAINQPEMTPGPEVFQRPRTSRPPHLARTVVCSS